MTHEAITVQGQCAQVATLHNQSARVNGYRNWIYTQAWLS